MESLTGIGRLIRDTVSYPSAEKLSQAGMALVKARSEIREAVQAATAKAMQPIIHKLKKNEPLSVEEKDLVRVWIVGDAAAFAKKENDCHAWLEELSRLGEAIGAVAQLPGSMAEMFDLHGNLEEAVRLAGDIQFFLEEKERLARFEQAIQNLTAADADLLAGILQEKLSSPEM